MEEDAGNEDVVVMDAEMSGASGADGYDINEQVQRLYDFGQDDTSSEMAFPVMAKHHRSVIFELTKKLSLQYVSGPKDAANAAASAPFTVEKPRNYKKVTWSSPYGPDSQRKKRDYDKIPLGHSVIIEGFLYLGSGRDADAIDTLLECGINHVVNVTQEWRSSPRLRENAITAKQIEIKDFVTESIAKHFEEAFAFLDQVRAAKGKVLIHCVIGKSRSASVVLAYLMARERMSLKEAFDHVRKTREFVRPNDNFLRELGAFEMQLFGVAVPSVVQTDLPPMKDPGTQHKLRAEKEEKLVKECITHEIMEPLALASKNLNMFLKKLREAVLRDFGPQIKATGIAEKKITKLINQTGIEFFNRRK